MVNATQFSVSMCVYGKDNPKHFDIAVRSILDQTIPPAEVVLVVDGPVPDELDQVINKYEVNPLFRMIRLAENQGHGNARRVGLQNCNYELVALMDADDISLPTRFSKEINAFIQDPNLSVVGSHVAEFFDNPNSIVSKRKVAISDYEIKVDMKVRCPMNQPSVMFLKKDVIEVGGYLDWYCNEDYYLWLRLALSGKRFANVDEELVKMRLNKESYKRRGGYKYFKSEVKLQKFMLEHRVIGIFEFCTNVVKRFIIQILLPNSLRGYVFRTFARG